MTKLSAAQQRIIDLLESGWTLNRNIGGWSTSCWMRFKSETGLVRDSDVSRRTIDVLCRQGLIEPGKKTWWVQSYRLTEQGRCRAARPTGVTGK